MVGVTELESVTSTMSTWRSNQLSYTPVKQRLGAESTSGEGKSKRRDAVFLSEKGGVVIISAIPLGGEAEVRL